LSDAEGISCPRLLIGLTPARRLETQHYRESDLDSCEHHLSYAEPELATSHLATRGFEFVDGGCYPRSGSLGRVDLLGSQLRLRQEDGGGPDRDVAASEFGGVLGPSRRARELIGRHPGGELDRALVPAVEEPHVLLDDVGR
jgi:hypothetical protein